MMTEEKIKALEGTIKKLKAQAEKAKKENEALMKQIGILEAENAELKVQHKRDEAENADLSSKVEAFRKEKAMQESLKPRKEGLYPVSKFD